MPNRLHALGVAAYLLSAALSQAAQIVYVGEDGGVVGLYGRDYQYVIIPDSVGGTPGPDWFKDSFDHSSWAIGETVFSNTGGIDTVPTRTSWPADTDVYVFKTFTLGTPVDMTAKTAVDNGYDIYVNGVFVVGANAEGFTSHWEYIDSLPAALFKPGLNSLAFHLEDHGGLTAWDFALEGDSSAANSVPEPATLALLSLGSAGFALLVRRR